MPVPVFVVVLRVADGVGTLRVLELDGRSPGGGSRPNVTAIGLVEADQLRIVW